MSSTDSSSSDTSSSSLDDALFPILNLPLELIEMVMRHLDDKSILCARQVCRAFSAYSMVEFGTRYFSHVIAILHPFSLTVLLEIARHPGLSKHVKRLTISGEQIGGAIHFDTPVDRDITIELQNSLEKSGMDRLVLGEAFRGFKNLNEVHVEDDAYVSPRVGFRCGKKHLIKKDGNPTPIEGGSTLSKSAARVFDAVCATIPNTPNFERIKWHLFLNIDKADVSDDKIFSPCSPVWKQTFAKNVEELQLYNGIPGRWGEDLLGSVTSVRVLVISGNSQIFTFSHPITGMWTWPKLTFLHLHAIKVSEDAMLKVLYAHKATVTKLNMLVISLIAGAWMDMFKCMSDMPRLGRIHFRALGQLDTPPNAGPLEIVVPQVDCHEVIKSSDKVLVAAVLSSLISRFRCRPCRRNDQLHHVDFSLAATVIAKRAHFIDGSWVLRDPSAE